MSNWLSTAPKGTKRISGTVSTSQSIQLTRISHSPSILVVQDLLCKHRHECYVWAGLGLLPLGSRAYRGMGEAQGTAVSSVGQRSSVTWPQLLSKPMTKEDENPGLPPLPPSPAPLPSTQPCSRSEKKWVDGNVDFPSLYHPCTGSINRKCA